MQGIEWKTGETYETERPADMEYSAGGRVKVRRNMTRAKRDTDNGSRRVWVYEYANMTTDQYKIYVEQLAQLDTPLALQIAENNTAQMEAVAALYEATLETQENQIAIMEGIAALYEMGVNAQ